MAYLTRLSDLLWLIGRYLESPAGVDGLLRDEGARSRTMVARVVTCHGPCTPVS
jgi:hypothetical protein